MQYLPDALWFAIRRKPRSHRDQKLGRQQERTTARPRASWRQRFPVAPDAAGHKVRAFGRSARSFAGRLSLCAPPKRGDITKRWGCLSRTTVRQNDSGPSGPLFISALAEPLPLYGLFDSHHCGDGRNINALQRACAGLLPG
jgi:hypothetical protein